MRVQSVRQALAALVERRAEILVPQGLRGQCGADRVGRWSEEEPRLVLHLKAHPHCTLLVSHRGEIPCIAREAEGVERDRAWQAAHTQYSGYAAYQQRTQRRIPVMMLDPEQTWFRHSTRPISASPKQSFPKPGLHYAVLDANDDVVRLAERREPLTAQAYARIN